MKEIYYTDSSGKKHTIVPLKTTFSFPCPIKEEWDALKKELAESKKNEGGS